MTWDDFVKRAASFALQESLWCGIPRGNGSILTQAWSLHQPEAKTNRYLFFFFFFPWQEMCCQSWGKALPSSYGLRCSARALSLRLLLRGGWDKCRLGRQQHFLGPRTRAVFQSRTRRDGHLFTFPTPGKWWFWRRGTVFFLSFTLISLPQPPKAMISFIFCTFCPLDFFLSFPTT